MTKAKSASEDAGEQSRRRDPRSDGPAEGPPDRERQRSLKEQYRDVEERYEDVRNQLESYNRHAVDFIRDNPAICIAGALGAGYLIGRLASKRWLT